MIGRRLKWLMVVAGGFLILPHAYAKTASLPNINSIKSVNEISFPKEAWGVDVLTIYELGPKFLPKDLTIALDAPPRNDSDAVRAELEVLRQYAREGRDAETISLIREENGEDPYLSIFGRADRLPEGVKNNLVEKLLRTTISETGYFILREKLKFARARPTQLAPDLTTVIDVPPHAAYPSGHGGQAYAAALVLSRIDPARAGYYITLAKDVAKRREIAGLHYPSDSVAGQKLAEQVVDHLMQITEFQDMFNKAKASIAEPSANR